jgi:hypothetical protein
VRLDDRAVNEYVLEVELVRQRVENTLEDARKRPAAEALEDAVPIAEALRKVAPGRSRPGPPENGFEKSPVVRRSGAGIGRLAGQHVLDPRPHGVGKHSPVCIHLIPARLPVPPFRRSLGQEMVLLSSIRNPNVNGP